MNDETNHTPDGVLGDLSFSEALAELERIVNQLEGGSLEIEDSLARYERGVALLRALQLRLADAQARVTVLLGELEPDSDDSVDSTLS